LTTTNFAACAAKKLLRRICKFPEMTPRELKCGWITVMTFIF